MAALSSRGVLIAEDEATIALDLEDFVERQLGAAVVGPFATIVSALDAISSHSLMGALVDVRLSDGQAGPVAAALAERGVPFVFITGYTELMVPEGFESRPIIQKPYEQAQLLRLVRDIFRS